MDALSLRAQWTLLLVISVLLSSVLHYFHVPAALLLGPMIVGVVMGLSGATMRIDKRLFLLAQAVLAVLLLAYALIGWSEELRFTRPIFLLALRTLPQMLASIFGLMLLCCGLA